MRRLSLSRLRVLIYGRKPFIALVAQLVFGILIGTLIGISARYEYEWDRSSFDDALQIAVSSNHHYNISIDNIYIRCVVLIHRKQKKKSRFVEAIKDTYSRRCNQTLYFMDSKKLQKEFAEELETVYVDTWQTIYHWNYYRHILQYISKNFLSKEDIQQQQQQRSKPLRSAWTVVGDEQLYLIVENLRKYLTKIAPQEALMLGRVTQTRSFLSFLFPFGGHNTVISTRAGVIFSDKALQAIQNGACNTWTTPTATEKALFSCASDVGVRIIDPVDREGMYLLHSGSPKSLVPLSSKYGIGTPYKNANIKVECCSDEAITFGDMNYKQQRMVDFLTRSKVFGVS